MRVLDKHFADKLIKAVTRADVVAWLGSEGACTRGLSVLSSVMKHAETLGLRPEGSNPCSGLRHKRSAFKARYPTEDDYRCLGSAIRMVRLSRPDAANVIEFLALTGARRGEALSLRWSYIHGARAVLPDSKCGPRTIWLAAPARALLARITRRKHRRYVFSCGKSPLPASAVVSAWGIARRMLRLNGMRIHDLRHGFASVAIANGHDLRTIGNLLGHKDFETTLGYAHLGEGRIAIAADRVSDRLAALMEGRSPDSPLPTT